jgi:hypothetical protein
VSTGNQALKVGQNAINHALMPDQQTRFDVPVLSRLSKVR